MPTFFRLFAVVLILCPLLSSAQTTPSYVKMDDGVIIYPNPDMSGNVQAVRLQILADSIIRVIASPESTFSTTQSLSTSYKTSSITLPEWKIAQANSKEKITLQTKRITAMADLTTGRVEFYDETGKLILGEKKMSRQLNVTAAQGEKTYTIRQAFETSENEAWYGLGQHQDGVVNYKGQQVFLFQNNTEVAVPFLISSKNYGLFWDNSSISLAGDIRPYRDISSLQLFSKAGEAGWLTATYLNDKNKPQEVLMEKAESAIKYEYLNDSKLLLPSAFTPATGSITWEGWLASGFSGIHKLKFTYGGYMKVWIDGKLEVDRWRMAWNPGTAIVNASLKKAEKVAIKIEWIPDGGESYATFKWLEPIERGFENTLGFLSEAGKQLDYYFIYGSTMDAVIGGYRTLTGKATMLPVWTFGLWQSRERYKTQEDVLNTVKEFRKRKIPLDNIVLDWSYWKENEWGSQDFEKTRFPDADKLIKELHEKYNTHFMISVWPKFYEGIDTYKEFDTKGWLYKRNIADRQRDWIGKGYVSTFYDAFNEGAQKGFWKLLQDKLYVKGVDAWWMDASEPDILSNVSPEKRKEQMHPLAAGNTSEHLNAYPLVNAKGIYEGQRNTDPNKRVFILTRSAFAGLQRYAAATWSGDISSRWHDMKLQIAAGINFSLSGTPYWTMDIGGFAVETRYENPTEKDLDEWRELNTRWYQFGAFVPLFRVHGQYPFREIYNVSPEGHNSYNSMLYYNKLRYRLLPYIYSLAGHTYLNNYTIMRGLIMDFAHDDAVKSIADQYMFGPSLLINPVYQYKERSRAVYLPKGQGWYDLYNSNYYEGGQTITANAAYETMPVYVKAGSILPFGPALQYTTEKKADTITLNVYAGKDGEFTLYEDEGLNYNYEKGIYATIKFSYNDAAKTLTIANKKGSFAGMLSKRFFRINYITSAKPVALNLDTKAGKLIKYTGKEVSVSLN